MFNKTRIDQTLSGKYAIATLNSLFKKKRISAQELKNQCDFILEIAQHGSVKQLLINPAIELHIKDRLLDNVMKKNNVHREISNCVKLLVENNRLVLLKDVLEKIKIFGEEASAKTNIKIKTAKELDEETRKRIRNHLKNSDIEFEIGTDNMLNGIIIESGEKILDMSGASIMNSLKKVIGINLY